MNALNFASNNRDHLVRGNYARGTTSGYILGKGSEEEVDAFIKVRNLLLQKEKDNKKLTGDLNEIKFRITFGTLQAIYWHPNNPAISGNIDLLGVEDPVIAEALQVYFAEANVEPEEDYPIEANSKGDKFGGPPLAKDAKDVPLQKLSITLDQTFEKLLPEFLSKLPPQFGSAEKQVITRRFHFVEYFHTKMNETITAKIAARSQALNVPGNNAEALQSEINKLQALQEELKSLDIYALFKLLSLYPIVPMQAKDKEAFAKHLFEQVSKEIKVNVESDWQQQAGVLAKVKDKLPFASKRQLTEAHLGYARDIAGMVYLDREGYFSHCRQNKLKTKKEGIADLFLREALKFSMHQVQGPGEEFKAEDFQKCIFLNKMGDALKAEMREELRDLGITASHAIGFGTGNQYQTKPLEAPPANDATDEEKKAVDERNAAIRAENAGALAKDIAAHRNLVDKNIDINTIRERWKQIPDPGILSMPVDMPLQKLAEKGGDLIHTFTPAPIQALARGAVSVMDALTPEILGILPSDVVQFAQNIPNMLPNQVALITAMSAGVHFLQEITPPAVFAEFSKIAPAFLVQAVETSKQNPNSFIAVATALGMLATLLYPNDYGKDGKVKRILNPKRVLLAGAMTAGGVALAVNYPSAVAQWFTSAVNYLSVPGNLINLLGWTVVGNRGLAYLKDRKIVPLLGVAALGGMLAYGQPMGVIGNVVSASSQVIANAVQYAVYSNPITGKMGDIVLGVASIAAPVVVPGIMAAGVKLYSRLLPQSIGSVLDNGAAQFSTNVQKVKAGQMLGAAANQAVGISTALLTKTLTTAYALFFFLQYFYMFLKRNA